MPKYGFFINPSPTSLSDLTNDNNYMAIREYILDSSVLANTTTVAINDISAGSTIVKVSLNVRLPFSNDAPTNTFEVTTDSGHILMNSNCNDPKIVNNYSTDTFYVMNGNINELVVHHNLANATSGLAILRIELYENLPDYEELRTSDNKIYMTKDQISVDVSK